MKKEWKREILSIPNLLGILRILLIPLFVVCCLRTETAESAGLPAVLWAIILLTDLLDGRIARKFNQETAFGRILDPIADALAQLAALVCLFRRYPIMAMTVIMFLLNDLAQLILALISLRLRKRPDGVPLCQRRASAMLYIAAALLLFLPGMKNVFINAINWFLQVYLLYAMIRSVLIYARAWAGKQPRKKWTGGKKRARKAVIAAVLIVYYALGITLSTLPQNPISASAAAETDTSIYYSDTLSGDRAQIISDNQDALDQRIRMIAQAEERILFSTFDFRSDEAGIQVIAALLDAADRGVKIEILADGMRSLFYMDGCPEFYALSSHENVEIRIYNQINIFLPWTFMGRLHDKYIVIDDDLYILGGRNTFSYFLGDTDGKHNYDWDVLIWNDGSGDGSLSQVEEYFYTVWNSSYVTVFHNWSGMADWPAVERAADELRALYAEIKTEHPDLFEAYDYASVTSETNQVTLLSNPINISSKEPTVFYTLTELMREADSVDWHTPYVIINDWMLETLAEVAAETELTMMTNSLANNGNLFGATFYREVKAELLEDGISLLEFDGGISYHGKVITMDDRLSLIGSYNLDLRSTYLDTELMLVIDSEAFCAVMQEEMQQYEAQSLTVIDAETSVAPEGAEAKTLSSLKNTLLNLISTCLGWAKFLM